MSAVLLQESLTSAETLADTAGVLAATAIREKVVEKGGYGLSAGLAARVYAMSAAYDYAVRPVVDGYASPVASAAANTALKAGAFTGMEAVFGMLAGSRGRMSASMLVKTFLTNGAGIVGADMALASMKKRRASRGASPARLAAAQAAQAAPLTVR